MTTTTRNEAAERLLKEAVQSGRGRLDSDEWEAEDYREYLPRLRRALAEARAEGAREAVERIRARLDAKRSLQASTQPVRWGFLETEIRAILDGEAAR